MLDCRLAVELNKLGIQTDIAAQYSKKFNGRIETNSWLKKGVLNVHYLNSDFKFGVFHAIYYLIKINNLHKYDAIISTNSGLDTYVVVVKFLKNSFQHIIGFHTYPNTAILNSLRVIIWKKILHRANGYFFISDFVRRKVESLLEIYSDYSSVIYNSYNPSSNRNLKVNIREEFDLNPKTEIILLIGRIESRKGFDIAIKASVELIKNKDVVILIVGEEYQGYAIENGLYGYLSELETIIKSLKIEEKVIFCGYRTDVVNIMRQADVLVHLARHEGFGIVLLEAIEAGLPIVASDRGGIPEVLEKTPYRTFSLDDRIEISNEIEKMLNMPEFEKIRIIEKAKEGLSFYTDSRRAREFEIFIKELVNA